MQPVTVHLHSQVVRRIQRATRAKDAFTGGALLLAGMERLRGEAHGPEYFAWAEIAVGAALVVLFVRELRSKHARHDGIAWFDLVVAVMLGLEGLHKVLAGRYAISIAYGFAATLTFVVGLFHARLQRRRRLTLDDEGIFVRAGRVRARRWSWDHIAGVRLEDASIHLTTHAGEEHRIDLGHIIDRHVPLAHVREHATARGLLRDAAAPALPSPVARDAAPAPPSLVAHDAAAALPTPAADNAPTPDEPPLPKVDPT